MFDGPELSPFASATSTSATLAGPDGAVAVAVVDNETPGLEGYLPAGMEVIPRAPLRALTTYTASVTASVTTGGGLPRAFAKSWSFQTGAASSARPYTVKVPKRVRHGRRIKVSIGAIADFSLRLRLSSPGGRTLLSNPKRTLAGGGVTWIYRLSVRRPYSRKGRKVRVTLVIGVDGKRYTERRTVKFT
jgi:hypothetical protein